MIIFEKIQLTKTTDSKHDSFFAERRQTKIHKKPSCC